LEVNDAIELRAGDTKLAPRIAQTTLGASESHFAHVDWQLGNLNADALCLRPAMLCNLLGIVRQPSSSRAASSWLVLGRVGQATGSLLYFAVYPKRHAGKEFAGHGTEARLSPSARPITASRRPLNVPCVGAPDMHVCYLLNDIDAERCRISLRQKSPISLFTFDIAGRVACLTGVVQSIQFDPNRATGMRWRVEMDLSAVALTAATPKARQ
jgi:hypothetical protein